jgi:hypothetical protein
MTTYFNDEMTAVQAQIGRADTKASILTGLALAALTGGTAIAGKAHLHGLAVAGAVLTACLIGAALVLLGAAIRPALGGNYGFVHWAAAPDAYTLRRDLQQLSHRFMDDASKADAEHLRLMACSARCKYQRIRLAVDLLGAALATAAITAILTGLGW